MCHLSDRSVTDMCHVSDRSIMNCGMEITLYDRNVIGWRKCHSVTKNGNEMCDENVTELCDRIVVGYLRFRLFTCHFYILNQA